ncbi:MULTISPECIES: helix-turn-helix domain-containing protein [unclassified Apibacter]|uniref:helix-turn-helix domain-containing protein n=1 Tax=unclassified Apibacter TaxID=2630820 RepID=UPI00135E9A0A|nr:MULTISPECIES: helix-turn-helix transcriptional regulator [unclassified Apibacter]MXP05578.1 helix-turn-helix domain-containing protein [Apibacter sp. B3546]MXP13148.1 helix-turn-helix domain-containing protein [Apibacter sp. B3239]
MITLQLEKLIKEKGVSKLAELLNVNRQTIYYYIKQGEKNSLETLETLSDALGVKISDLFIDNNDDLTGYIEYMGEVHKINSIQDLRNLLENIDGEKRNSDNKI